MQKINLSIYIEVHLICMEHLLFSKHITLSKSRSKSYYPSLYLYIYIQKWQGAKQEVITASQPYHLKILDNNSLKSSMIQEQLIQF